jgi:hypothetical protein
MDVTLLFFRDLLADKPLNQAGTINSLADVGKSVVAGDKGEQAAGKIFWDSKAADS